MNKAQKFWDKRAGGFDRDAKKTGETFSRNMKMTRNYLNSDDHVLDFGCANGKISNHLSSYVKRILAIDISQKMIDSALHHFDRGKNNNVSYQCSTLSDISVNANDFDIVLGFNVLHLLEDTEEAIKHVHNLLKPKGTFISTTPCRSNRKTILDRFFLLIARTGLVPHLRFRTTTKLDHLIQKAGFEIIESQTQDSGPINYFVVARKLSD